MVNPWVLLFLFPDILGGGVGGVNNVWMKYAKAFEYEWKRAAEHFQVLIATYLNKYTIFRGVEVQGLNMYPESESFSHLRRHHVCHANGRQHLVNQSWTDTLTMVPTKVRVTVSLDSYSPVLYEKNKW